MINYFRNDFASVRGAHLLFTNNKMPMWASIVLYAVMLPFGLLLMPFAMLFRFVMLKKMEKDFERLHQ